MAVPGDSFGKRLTGARIRVQQDIVKNGLKHAHARHLDLNFAGSCMRLPNRFRNPVRKKCGTPASQCCASRIAAMAPGGRVAAAKATAQFAFVLAVPEHKTLDQE